eukprot:GILI01035486.1.p1 GENE.GILI01035486.1~~GILI01035486.1.p1  ORF type:complete len:215 (-),score=6.55 GILI01035486.1:25-669(-)
MAAEICAVHGKRRLIQDLALEDGQWRCLPYKQCRMEAQVRAEAEICSVHGKRRYMQDLAIENGQWRCLPHKPCRDIPPRPVGTQVAPPYDGPNAGQPALSSSMAAPQPRFVGQGVGPRGDVWCHLHGRRVPIFRTERIDDTFNVCRDRFVCLTSALDPPELLVAAGCPEIFCSLHGALRAPQFLVLGEKGYRCSDNHPCSGATSQAMLERSKMQ